jgi:outer membrane protein assembly factor BamB
MWRTNILSDSDARNLDWGMAAAPLIVDNTVIVLPGGSNGQSIVGYDRLSGKRVWSALGDKQAYSSPMLVTLNGVRQLLVVSATRMMGLVPGDGKLLWEYPFPTYNGINAAQPLVIGDNRVFVSASYGAGCAMVELSRDGERFAVRELWRNSRMKNRFSGSVLHKGVIYGLDEGILAALDVETGELKWKGGRYGYGQVLLAGNNLIVLTEDGDLALVRATPDRHQELTRFPVLEGKTWNVNKRATGVPRPSFVSCSSLSHSCCFCSRRSISKGRSRRRQCRWSATAERARNTGRAGAVPPGREWSLARVTRTAGRTRKT